MINISKLQVYDNYENLLISLGELDENLEYRFSSHEVLYDGQNVGMIQLDIDNSQINFARSMSLKLSILLTIIIVLTVTSTSYFLTRKLVLKPL